MSMASLSTNLYLIHRHRCSASSDDECSGESSKRNASLVRVLDVERDNEVESDCELNRNKKRLRLEIVMVIVMEL